MESKLAAEILNFYLNLAETRIQAQKVENKLKKYSREWAQINSFREKCRETQRVLARLVGEGK